MGAGSGSPGRWSAGFAAWLPFLILIALVLGCAPPAPPATPTTPPGARLRSTTGDAAFFSAALGAEMPYTVYLPPDPIGAGGPYPTLYMLHGMGGKRSEWVEMGLLGAADRLIESGAIAPLVIVLPQGDQGYWLDQADGPQWASYLARDLVASVDERYPTVPSPRARAVGGLSMGAYGALHVALAHPGVFGIVGAHTPTLREFDAAREWFGPDLTAAFYGDRAGFEARDPVGLYRERAGAARQLTLRLDVGADDPWRPLVERFRDGLGASDVPHEWAVLDGSGHGEDHSFWARHAPEFLRFYDRALRAAR